MSLKTNFTKKLKRLFAKKESTDLLGIALRQKSLAFGSVSLKNIMHNQSIAIRENNYSDALNALSLEHGVKGQTYLVLSSSLSQIVQIDKPNIPDEELLPALKWQIKDLVSVAPENMLIDYYDGMKLGGVEKIHVVCTSLPDIKELTAPLLQEPFTLRSITTEEFAFTALVPEKNEASLIVCQQPGEEIVLIIVKEGKLSFHRRLRGFAHLAEKTESELTAGLVDNLSLEIQRSTDYFERQMKQAPIKSIEVLTPMANEAFLARKLSENTNVPVSLFAMPEGFSDYRENAVSLGAIIPQLRSKTLQESEKIESSIDAPQDVTNG